MLFRQSTSLKRGPSATQIGVQSKLSGPFGGTPCSCRTHCIWVMSIVVEIGEIGEIATRKRLASIPPLPFPLVRPQ